MLDVVYIQISILLYDCSPILHLYRCLDIILYPFFIWFVPNTTLCFHQSTAIVVIEEGSAIPSSVTNRYPIFDIFCLKSVEIVFSLLSNIRLLGMDTRPQASTRFRLYWQSVSRKVCNALLQSNRNHILTIKHLRITFGEYT